MVVETPKTIRVAVTQHEPEWLDMPSAVDKTCHLIAEAAANKADIITFPECWIPGYPAWIWYTILAPFTYQFLTDAISRARPVDMELARQYIQNCVAYGSPEMQQICDAASQNKIAVVLGFSENDSNSVYISQCTIDDSGEIVMKRRKLKPTHMERTIFGDASGPSLLNVKKLSVGKVGALSCWEHIQPLLKYHTMCQREEIHVSAWPPLDPHPGGEALWGMSAEGCTYPMPSRLQIGELTGVITGCLALSQTYAAESATFVLHTTAVITEKGIDKMQTKNGIIFNSPGGGSSAIVGPDGRVLSTALPPTEEGFIYADLDMQLLVSCRHFVDACGHYSRPDMLWLGVDTREKAHCQSTGDSEAAVQV